MNRRLIVGVSAVLIVGAAALWAAVRRQPSVVPQSRIPGGEDRITVEVLNASALNGLARDVTRRLRRAGIDVVFVGDAPGPPIDSTRILVRRGDSLNARPIQNVLRLGRIVLQPDAQRLLDVTLLLGADAAAPLNRRP